MLTAIAISLTLFFVPTAAGPERPLVTAERAPNSGLQPQAVMGPDGTLHLLTYHGDPKGGDLSYRSRAKEETWSAPLRVNSTPGCAIAMGNDRGGHIALGRDGTVHVAWNGSTAGKAQGESPPMLYARLLKGGTAFEEQRNLMVKSRGLDGGGSVAADDKGRVYVAWHGLPADPKAKGEVERRVFVAVSEDDGKTFASETPVSDAAAGACGCCGLRAVAAPGGELVVLYRAAGKGVDRDSRLLRSTDGAKTFSDTGLDPWKANTCPMTTASATPSGSGWIIAWETQQRIRWATLSAELTPAKGRDATEGGKGQRYPSVAVDETGRVLIAWTEGMRWNTGGKACWRVFDAAGKLVAGGTGEAEGVAPWGLVAAAPRAGGGFTVFY